MPRPIPPNSPAAAIIAEELALLQRVSDFLSEWTGRGEGRSLAHDAELIELRDAIAEAKPEDVAPLVEQMARVSAVAAGRRGKAAAPIDVQTPYFAHLRIRPSTPARAPARDVLIGRRGLIDRNAGIQIVDWRDAPVSQIYYRYDEGDDYDDQVGQSRLQGVVEARRSVSIQSGKLRRIACPLGTYFIDEAGTWWEADQSAAPTLAGGMGLAARAPRSPQRPAAGRPEAASFATRTDKHLPEIAALIDKHQFGLITEPESGVVVIQGGAGSGKTTVALHRVAYLAHNKPERFRGAKVMIVVPTESLVRYVSGVLPALGVSSVPVVTCLGWHRHHVRRLLPHLSDKVNEDTPPVISRLKKHPCMLEVLDGYVADQAASVRAEIAQLLATNPQVAERVLGEWDARSARPLRARCRAIRSLLSQLIESTAAPGYLVAALDRLRRLSRRVINISRDWAEILTDSGRLQRGLGASEGEVAELVAHARAQQEEVEELPSGDDVDPERFLPIDGRPLDEDSLADVLDAEDLPILLRLFQLKFGGLPHSNGKDFVRYEHLVLDEVQDLSVVEIKVLLDCMNREHHAPSVTMAGDVVQRLIFDNGFTGWEDLLPRVGLPDVTVQRLHILYRSTVEVMELAHAVLGPLRQSSGDVEQQAVRHGAPVAAFDFHEVGEAVAFLAEALRSLLGREPTASVALIARRSGTAELLYRGLSRAEVPMLRHVERHEFTFTPGIDVTDVTQVKGLEFDYVVIADASESAYPDTTESRHLLHIAMTRAAHQLWLVAVGPPSPLIPRDYFQP